MTPVPIREWMVLLKEVNGTAGVVALLKCKCTVGVVFVTQCR